MNIETIVLNQYSDKDQYSLAVGVRTISPI